MIDLDGTYEFNAPRDLLWEMILDPEILARILPGCDKLVIVDDNEYHGQMRIKIGPVDGVFKGNVILSDLDPLQGFHLVVNGRGPSGVVKGEGDVRLQDNHLGTNLLYSGTGQISGRMATVGQRVMTSSANAIVKQSLQNLENQVQARLQPVQEAMPGSDRAKDGLPSAGALPPAPSQMEFMRGVAENMLEEYIPDPNQRKLITSFALITMLMLLLNIFANIVARRVVKMIEEDGTR